MGIEIKGDEIVINRELSELDRFVLDVIDVVEKHARYVIVSGYVTILFGRSRGTEDVDFVIESGELFIYEENINRSQLRRKIEQTCRKVH